MFYLVSQRELYPDWRTRLRFLPFLMSVGIGLCADGSFTLRLSSADGLLILTKPDILSLEVQDWLDLLQVNLIGPFLGIKHAAMHMIEHGGGSILCTASVAGLRSGAGGPQFARPP